MSGPEETPGASDAAGSNGDARGAAGAGDAGAVTDAEAAWREDGRLRRLFDDNFIRYASYVIRERAIPDLADGLKPVQRRILHSLRENDDGRFVKVANVVGHAMQYHPHGDASIGEALVALANRRYLIEGQGNFGNLLTGDRAAAARYIECRLTELAREHLFNDELTRFVSSYDGRRKEPVALPSKLPLLLMLGADGIAVGLSTRVLPHNFVELLEAQIAILDDRPFELLPDFQQGGLMDATEYDRGRGRVRLRALVEPRGDDALVIRSVPHGTTTDSVIASIEAAARKKKLRLKAIDDFTAEAVEIEVRLAAGQDRQRAMQALYAFTQCEVAVASGIVVIHRRRPVEMGVDEVLRHDTRSLLRRLKRELEVARRHLVDRLHDRTLVQIFVEDRIYQRIERCTSWPRVQAAVLEGVSRHRDRLQRDVTARDVEMLLGIKIKRISRYDMEKNRGEIDGVVRSLAEVDRRLADLVGHTRRFLRRLIRKYADVYPRRTRVTTFDTVALRQLTADELTLAYDRERGYLGHEVAGETLFRCSPLDRLLIVAGDGRYRVSNPPDKLFVDRELRHCGPYDRDRVFSAVYRDDSGLLYVKRFTFGGVVLNREYRCVPRGTELLFLSDEASDRLYVKYARRAGELTRQEAFGLGDVPVRGPKTRGTLMTSRPAVSFHATRPRGWTGRGTTSPGRPLGAR